MPDPLTRAEVRALLGEPRERRFADMILNVLDVAERDAAVAEQDRGRSSRQSLTEEAGMDVHADLREFAEAIAAMRPDEGSTDA